MWSLQIPFVCTHQAEHPPVKAIQVALWFWRKLMFWLVLRPLWQVLAAQLGTRLALYVSQATWIG